MTNNENQNNPMNNDDRTDNEARLEASLAAQAAETNATLVRGLTRIREKLAEQGIAAAQKQNADEMKAVAQKAKTYAAQIGRFADTGRADEKLLELQTRFSELADDLLLATNGELPQRADDSGEEWKK